MTQFHWSIPNGEGSKETKHKIKIIWRGITNKRVQTTPITLSTLKKSERIKKQKQTPSQAD